MALTIESLKNQKEEPITTNIPVTSGEAMRAEYFRLANELEQKTGANMHRLARARLSDLMNELRDLLSRAS